MKIAVVGSGISGLSCAWALSRHHDVTVFEKRGRAGGHAATVDIDYDGQAISVDTGFIVYNELNYPLLTKLFSHLNIETQPTVMTFSVSLDDGRLEWRGNRLSGIFAQPRNLFSPGFLKMLGDIVRFNANANRDLETGALNGLSIDDYLLQNRYSRRLRDHYLIPLTSAIWSTPAQKMLEFPAESLIRFLHNHHLIQRKRPPWRTVSGGSRHYVDALLSNFKGRFRKNCEIAGIDRHPDHVTIKDNHGHSERFDQIVLATHCDQSLNLLNDANPTETSILSAVEYTTNEVYLHRDPTLMPMRKNAWASWNYIGRNLGGFESGVSVTYCMNSLQHIPARYPLFISLNPVDEPDDALVFGRYRYAHPQFNSHAIHAQKRLPLIQGENRTWFCGAWTGYGFHEDGLASGLNVAARLGAGAPFETGIPLETPQPDIPDIPAMATASL